MQTFHCLPLLLPSEATIVSISSKSAIRSFQENVTQIQSEYFSDVEVALLRFLKLMVHFWFVLFQDWSAVRSISVLCMMLCGIIGKSFIAETAKGWSNINRVEPNLYRRSNFFYRLYPMGAAMRSNKARSSTGRKKGTERNRCGGIVMLLARN